MKRRFNILLLVLSLALGLYVYGCGGSDVAEPDGNGDTIEGDVATGKDTVIELELDAWENPENMFELVSLFKELRYTINTGFDTNTIHYRYEGNEVIGGAETEKITLQIDEESFAAWVDGSGKVVQAEMGGELMDEELADIMTTAYLDMALMPFLMAGNLSISEMIRDSIPGYSVRLTGTKQEKIGDLTAVVHSLEITMGPPVISAGEKFTYIWRIADFGQFQTLISWKVVEQSEGSGQLAFEFEIDKISLR